MGGGYGKGKAGGKGMKRPNMAGSGDPEKHALVEQIKDFQRSGEENKQAWWDFCEQQEFKKRDPALQSIESLQMFCANVGIVAWGESAMKKARMGDPEKDALVEKIKNFQRSGERTNRPGGHFVICSQSKSETQ